ncbi:hypothetical protein RC62_4340 [Flavobacterium aquidurense]|uniref:Uncharacterized protein n=1 Tax=Flavobacterium aquidurense TaxID=362413 RepID=A0A0Q0W2W9_9FLAO|nr:hypothetical protein RC62_4340 [Flavobacterium aquidurense]
MSFRRNDKKVKINNRQKNCIFTILKTIYKMYLTNSGLFSTKSKNIKRILNIFES